MYKRGRGRPVAKKQKLQDPLDEAENSEDKVSGELVLQLLRILKVLQSSLHTKDILGPI